MADYYDREGNRIDLMTWATRFEDREAARVGYDTRDGITVSTVFLGLDHNWGKGPPLVYETMIFGGEHNDYQERYSTEQEAEQGHQRALALAFGQVTA